MCSALACGCGGENFLAAVQDRIWPSGMALLNAELTEKPARESAERCPALRQAGRPPLRYSAQPQINRPFHFGFEWKSHLLSGPRGVIRGVHDFQHGAAILAGDKRPFVLPDAFDEVFQLLRITLV